MSSQYFPPYDNSSGNIKVELDLSNYATKGYVRNITHVDVSSYASKTNLAALKTDDLAKLTNVVKNETIKKLISMLTIMSKRLKLIKLIKKFLM